MDRINFTVNGVSYSVGNEVSSDVTLLDYLRRQLELRGTKYMCREGGCGACVVTAVKKPGAATTAINSCLVSITSCQDWDITTIEKIGNRRDGYHPVQKTLAEYNGTQCGYCTPGWVMLMYSLLKAKGSTMTMLDIEKRMSSNICRCTGYRSIMDAFKTFGNDAPKSKLADIEELDNICNRTGDICNRNNCSEFDWCHLKKPVGEIKKELKLKDNRFWYKVETISDVFNILRNHSNSSYMLVAGNSGKGVYPILDYPDILIDISDITELKEQKVDQNLILGAGLTLNEILDILKNFSTQPYFEYLLKVHDHIFFIANTSVRDLATIGGNLMIKHAHHDFQSDIFLLLETIGATLTIVSIDGSSQEVIPKDFLNIDMTNKILKNVKLPPLNQNTHKFCSFKIMPRFQNSPALVNTGFLYQVDTDQETVIKATIVLGNINPNFIHAQKTESYFVGKKLFNNNNLQGALNQLNDELNNVEVVGHSDEEKLAKKKLALSLLYKGLLTLCPTDKINERYRSGRRTFNRERPVSHGSQFYETNPDIWPLNKPIPKVEALIQCAGEAPYMDDIQTLPQEVFAQYVLSTVANGHIDKIDASAALALEGVIAFYTAEDIPGRNSFIPRPYIFFLQDEEALCDGKIKFHGQPIGIIVAETDHIAQKAATLVKITYKNMKKPVLTIDDAKKELGRVLLVNVLPAIDRGLDVAKVIKGKNEIHSQYHFHMEKQTCVTRPTDDGMEINSSTQFIDGVQIAVARALDIKENTINMQVRRIGGGFGAKITRSNQIAVACSLVTHKLNRPCRMVLPLVTNMKAIGKRLPSTSEFEVSVDKVGEIQHLEYNLYEDNGYTINEPFVYFGIPALKNCYNRNRWIFKGFDVMTDTCKNSWCRSPGSLEYIAMIEYIMEQISYEISLDPINVRLINMSNTKEDEANKEMIETLKKNAEYEKRRTEINQFNEENRWKKRGLRIACMKWPLPTIICYNTHISVHHGDGTVVITHGGIEMGQGINTKAVQVCAYCLNIPIEKIKIKATNNISNVNSMLSGGSFTSESICFGVLKCCQLLLDRLQPIRIKSGPVQWEDLIKAAYNAGVNLFTSYTTSSNDINNYNISGATLCEAEVDVLTGEIEIRRVDLIEDVGQSMNPEIDVGQIEGAFIMGLGYWTCEDLLYDHTTGEMITDRTWTYHVPQANDIPIDFRIYFRRNTYNEKGVLGSKATGEPAICMSVCVAFAIREAIAASRLESGIPTNNWFHIDGPYTLNKIILANNVKLQEYMFN